MPAERFGDILDKDVSLGPVGIVGDAMLPRSIAETFQEEAWRGGLRLEGAISGEQIEQKKNFLMVRLDVLMGVTKIVDTLFGK